MISVFVAVSFAIILGAFMSPRFTLFLLTTCSKIVGGIKR
jgi:hypothetical protein